MKCDSVKILELTYHHELWRQFENEDFEPHNHLTHGIVNRVKAIHPNLELLIVKRDPISRRKACSKCSEQWRMYPQISTYTVRIDQELYAGTLKDIQHEPWPGWKANITFDLTARCQMGPCSGHTHVRTMRRLLGEDLLRYGIESLNAPCLHHIGQAQEIMEHRRQRVRIDPGDSQDIDIKNLTINIAPFTFDDLSIFVREVGAELEGLNIVCGLQQERKLEGLPPLIGLEELPDVLNLVETSMPRLKRLTIDLSARIQDGYSWPIPTTKTTNPVHAPLEVLTLVLDCESDVYYSRSLHIPSLAANLARLCDMRTILHFKAHDRAEGRPHEAHYIEPVDPSTSIECQIVLELQEAICYFSRSVLNVDHHVPTLICLSPRLAAQNKHHLMRADFGTDGLDVSTLNQLLGLEFNEDGRPFTYEISDGIRLSRGEQMLVGSSPVVQPEYMVDWQSD